MKKLTILLTCWPLALSAAPPGPGTEDYEVLAPHSAWLHEQKNPQSHLGCCDQTDCRTVRTRTVEGQLQAYIEDDKWVEGPNRWLTVPAEVVHHEPNPVGLPLACWSAWHDDDEGFYCFWPGSQS